MEAVEQDEPTTTWWTPPPERWSASSTPGRSLTRSSTRPGAPASRASSSWTGSTGTTWCPPRGRSSPPTPAASSPCCPMRACNLGSINLVNHAEEEPRAAMPSTGTSWQGHHPHRRPLPGQRHRGQPIPPARDRPGDPRTRKIGLGVMGFADMLLLLGVPYNSRGGRGPGRGDHGLHQRHRPPASEELAKVRGPSPSSTRASIRTGSPCATPPSPPSPPPAPSPSSPGYPPAWSRCSPTPISATSWTAPT